MSIRSSHQALLCAVIGGVAALMLWLAPTPALAQQSCPANSEAYTQETTSSGTVVHCRCISGYENRGGACQPVQSATLAPAPQQPASNGPTEAFCTAARARVATFRKEIETQSHLREENQEFLKEWNSEGKDGAKDLVVASVDAVFGALEAGTEAEAEEYNEYARSVESLQAKLTDPGAQARIVKINLLLKQMQPTSAAAHIHGIAALYNDSRFSWEAMRGAMNNAFRTGADNSKQFHDLLAQDVKARESLAGPDDQDPAVEASLDLGKKAVEGGGELIDKYSGYTKMAGPTARVVNFVFEASLADYKIALSTQNVDLADANAGSLARAAGIMQAKYQSAINDLRTCR